MKTLGSVDPTSEQLIIIDNPAPGYWLVRGAAGSGKTTTALLRLKFLVRYWRERRANLGLDEPVRVLVLTFNRTLRGYIAELASQQVAAGPDLDLEVSTFGSWSRDLVGGSPLNNEMQTQALETLAPASFNQGHDFIRSEVNYALGRFLPKRRDDYLTAARTGRGRSPTVDRARFLEEVIKPYVAWKKDSGLVDWNDLAVALALERKAKPYDIVLVDEAQDFSANQVRAVVNHLADEFSCTFIRDTTQRIYPNAFTWTDVDVQFDSGHSRELKTNYRNTRQIAALARPLVDGIEGAADGSLPDFNGAERDGAVPLVLRGKYSNQLDWAISYLRSPNVGADETVAFLHPMGGGWFTTLQTRLDQERIAWTSIAREAEWPAGPEHVALSTMHSAKGLEFDHVLLLGYNAQVVRHGDGPNDVRLDNQRRLLAMALGRARRSVVIGYKPEDESPLVDFLDEAAFKVEDV